MARRRQWVRVPIADPSSLSRVPEPLRRDAGVLLMAVTRVAAATWPSTGPGTGTPEALLRLICDPDGVVARAWAWTHLPALIDAGVLVPEQDSYRVRGVPDPRVDPTVADRMRRWRRDTVSRRDTVTPKDRITKSRAPDTVSSDHPGARNGITPDRGQRIGLERSEIKGSAPPAEVVFDTVNGPGGHPGTLSPLRGGGESTGADVPRSPADLDDEGLRWLQRLGQYPSSQITRLLEQPDHPPAKVRAMQVILAVRQRLGQSE